MKSHENIDSTDDSEYLFELFKSRLESKTVADQPYSPWVFVELLKSGVRGTILQSLVKSIPEKVVLDALDTDKTNLYRLMRKKRLSPKQTEELNDLTAVWSELMSFFDNNKSSVRDWIIQSLPALDGGCVLDLISSHYGRNEVRLILEKMKYGDFD